jgi:hypothetical protein
VTVLPTIITKYAGIINDAVRPPRAPARPLSGTWKPGSTTGASPASRCS